MFLKISCCGNEFDCLLRFTSKKLILESREKELIRYVSQTRRAEYQSIGLLGSFKKIAKTEGVLGFYRWIPSHYHSLEGCFHPFSSTSFGFLYRGNGASVARIVPYAALHYMAYEQYRRWIIDTFPDVWRGPILDLVAGSFAGGTAVLFTYPLDLVRTKLAYQVNYWTKKTIRSLSLFLSLPLHQYGE